MNAPIELGHEHWLTYTSWEPDRKLNPQYEGIPDIPRYGARIEHLGPNGEQCAGAVTFDLPEVRALTANDGHTPTMWQVESWEPLTLSPSILCRRCGDHGYIRDGKWVPA